MTLTINHIDGNSLNNTIENLEYMSNLDNVNHYLNSKGLSLVKVIHLNSGTMFDSIRQAAKFNLKSKGIEQPTRNMIELERKKLYRNKDYNLIRPGVV